MGPWLDYKSVCGTATSAGKSRFVERGLLIAFNFLVLSVLFAHLRPVDCHDPGKDIGIQLGVFYVAKMLGKSFGRQGLRLALAAFVSPDPPTLDILSSVDPNLLHNTESIVISEVQIKRKKTFR